MTPIFETAVASIQGKKRQPSKGAIPDSARFEEIGRLTSGLMHELLNPLMAAALNIQALQDKISSAEAKRYLKGAMSGIRRIESLAVDIQKLSGREGGRINFSAREELERVLRIFAFRARQAKVLLTVSAGEKIEVSGDAVQFLSACSAIISRAIDIAEKLPAGKREVSVSLSRKKNTVLLTVRPAEGRVLSAKAPLDSLA